MKDRDLIKWAVQQDLMENISIERRTITVCEGCGENISESGFEDCFGCGDVHQVSKTKEREEIEISFKIKL